MQVETIERALELPPFTIPAAHFRAEPAAAALLLLPALGTTASYYRPFAEALCRAGCSVLLPELPGTGDSRPRPSWKADYGYPDLVCRYLTGLAGLARRLQPGLPLIIAGHSLGAQVAALGLLHRALEADAVITIAAGHIHYRNWKGPGAAAVLLMAALAASTARLFGHMPGHWFGFGGPQARTLMRQWSRFIRTGRLPEVPGKPPAEILAPALSIGYEGDFMAPPESVAGLVRLLHADRRTLPASRPGNPHLSWARNPGSTVEAIRQWLDERGGPALAAGEEDT